MASHKPGELTGNAFSGENRPFCGEDITNAGQATVNTKDAMAVKNPSHVLISVPSEGTMKPALPSNQAPD